jgi:hypothetical protein
VQPLVFPSAEWVIYPADSTMKEVFFPLSGMVSLVISSEEGQILLTQQFVAQKCYDTVRKETEALL